MFFANTCSEHFFVIFSPLFQNLTELNEVVPDTASSANKLATMSDLRIIKTGTFTGTTTNGIITSNIPLTTNVISAYNRTGNGWMVSPIISSGDSNWRFIVFGADGGYIKPRASGQTHEIVYYYVE